MVSRLNPTNFGYQNFYSALLTADITSGALTISLDTVPTPTSGILVIDPDSTTNREVILYTSKGASTINLPSDGRGFDGSTGVAHLTGTTIIMAPVSKMFSALASGETSTDPLRTETFFDHVNSGAVWTGDSLGSTRNASMAAGVMYILGRRLTLAIVTARSFTASKDTYIDATDNLDGTALLTYTEVSNNAASPALATNAVRIGIIVTGATTIAAAGSVNQGQEDRVLPIVSSTPYAVTDSLGNLICPRDPNRKLIGYRQITGNFNTSSATFVQLTGLSVPVIVPTGRKVRISVYARDTFASGTTPISTQLSIWDGTVPSGTELQEYSMSQNTTTGLAMPASLSAVTTPATSSKTYNVGMKTLTAGGTSALDAAATYPAYILVEVE